MKKLADKIILLGLYLLLLLLVGPIYRPQQSAHASQAIFERGEVFVGLNNGKVQRRSAQGNFIQNLDTGRTGEITGMAFDGVGNLYATAFTGGTIVKFSNSGNLLGTFGSGYNGSPESILFDAAGNVYVGAVNGDNDIRKFNANGQPLTKFDVAMDRRGSDWIELAADQCTLYYTSEGKHIKRFDVCKNTQLPDFVSNLPGLAAFALRLLPSGGMLVADFDTILRLDKDGNVLKSYDAPEEDRWFALNLDPDGKSFWSANLNAQGSVYKFDIETGNRLVRFETGASASGLTIAGEITVSQPKTGADLALTVSAAPNPVGAGAVLTQTLTITNRGPNEATNVILTAPLPSNAAFQSVTAPPGWSCEKPTQGASGTVSCRVPTLASGANAVVTLAITINCVVADGATLSQTSRVESSLADPLPSNNTATATVTVKKSLQPVRITINGGKSSFDFGAIPALREINSSAPSETFTVENPGCGALTIKLQRTGADVTSGKISNPDDSAIFSLLAIGNDGSERPVAINPGAPPLQLAGGQKQTFKLRFHPLIPTLSGKTSALFANQAIPDLITSQLIFAQEGGSAAAINITARVGTLLQLIHPVDPRLSPLVVFTHTGIEFTVECTVHDPNLDLYLARYQFLDQNDRAVGGPADVDLTQPIAQRGLVRGQSFSIIQKFVGLRNDVAKVRVTLYDREANVVSAATLLGAPEPALASVSAASFQASSLASEAIAAAFGTNLSASTLAATTLPLPTNLDGTSVKVRDGGGTERLAPLFFVSPTQINYQIPPGTGVGAATVTALRNGQPVAREVAQIGAAAPAIFAANSNGQGVAAAIALHVAANGSQQFSPVAKFDQSRNQFVSVPLSFGAASDQLFLLLFGSGIRFGNQVGVKIGGTDAPVSYAGAQGSFVGLDQINVLVPRSLSGHGELDIIVTVDGKPSNAVKVNLGGSSSFAAIEQVRPNSPPFVPAELSADAPILRLPTITFDGRFIVPARDNKSQSKAATKQQEQQP